MWTPWDSSLWAQTRFWGSSGETQWRLSRRLFIVPQWRPGDVFTAYRDRKSFTVLWKVSFSTSDTDLWRTLFCCLYLTELRLFNNVSMLVQYAVTGTVQRPHVVLWLCGKQLVLLLVWGHVGRCHPHHGLLVLCCVPAVKPRSPQVWNVTFNQESNQAFIYIHTPYHNNYLKVDNQLFQLHIWNTSSSIVRFFDLCGFFLLGDGWVVVHSLFLFDHSIRTSPHQTTPSWRLTWSVSKVKHSTRSEFEPYQEPRVPCRVPGATGARRSVSLLLLETVSQLLLVLLLEKIKENVRGE